MWISNIQLDGFRNYKKLSLDLPQGLVFIHGDNGQGKSNLLEAFHLLSVFKSLRASREVDLINLDMSRPNNTAYALISAEAHRNDAIINIKLMIENQPSEVLSTDNKALVKKKIRFNGNPQKASEVIGLIPSILVSPDDIQLISGPPSLRRRFLDLMISQVDRQYLYDLRRYLKVLFHRNSLLKSINNNSSPYEQLTHWDTQLVKTGVNLLTSRVEAISFLQASFQTIFKSLTNEAGGFSLDYISTVPFFKDQSDLAMAFSEQLLANQSKDFAVGSTSVGPHRDDICLRQNGRNVATYASRGQARILTLLLKLGQAIYTEHCRGEQPILLLDDVLAELDDHSRERLIQYTEQYQQVILTSTNMNIAKPKHQTTFLHLEQGEFRETPYLLE
jgi:DNA replication and repair protein RecF